MASHTIPFKKAIALVVHRAVVPQRYQVVSCQWQAQVTAVVRYAFRQRGAARLDLNLAEAVTLWAQKLARAGKGLSLTM